MSELLFGNASATPLAVAFLWVLLSYLIGNISPATLVARAAGVDIRKEGSGNPGTTNVLRVLGKRAAVATLLIDILKGTIPVLLGRYFGTEWLAAFCGFAAFLGHLWPVAFRFKGGKGIATAFGMIVAFHWGVGLICLAVALAGALLSRRMSVGSIAGAIALPIMISVWEKEYLPLFAVIALLVIYRHRANIKRIIKGEEPKLNFKK